MKPSGIGGQAVIEGVMMKNKNDYAVAIRKPDNTIEVKKDVYISLANRIGILKIPILRGVASFIDSLVLGMRTLSYSAEFYDEDEKPDKNKKRSDSLAMTITMMISVLIAVAIFVLLPFYITELIKGTVTSDMARSAIESAIRLLLFIIYIRIITLMEDVKRVYMYHGAEHKVINCLENGCELTVDNAKRQTKEHKRCGTSFLLYVILLSCIFFVFIDVDTMWLRMLLRIVLVPFIAGIAYEFIKLAGRSDNPVMNILSKPGLWLQGLTTKEPDDSMLEVAIASVKAVYDEKEKVPDSLFEQVSLSDEEDEEEDEILKALDRFFSMPDEESDEDIVFEEIEFDEEESENDESK